MRLAAGRHGCQELMPDMPSVNESIRRLLLLRRAEGHAAVMPLSFALPGSWNARSG